MVILGLCIIDGNLLVRAETVGKGARIIIYGESGSARFRLGGAVGGQVELAAEPTGSKTLSDISFTTSDSAVCSVEKVDDYWLVKRLKEGTAVIRMACKAGGDVVVRTLLMSNLTFLNDGMGEFVVGSIKADATVYWGCSDVEGITSYDTEIKCKVTRDTEVDVVAKCNDFYRVELEEGTFGDTEEEWGYVKKRRLYSHYGSFCGRYCIVRGGAGGTECTDPSGNRHQSGSDVSEFKYQCGRSGCQRKSFSIA